jgi:hypothetical protein
MKSKHTKEVVKSLPLGKNSPGPDGFVSKFHKTLKERLIIIVLNVF